MMAPTVRHRRTGTPSASGRHSDRFDTIDVLESLDSGPQPIPVAPAYVLDPKGGSCAVSWHGRAREVDGVVSAGRPGGGGERGPHPDDRAGAGGAGAGDGPGGRGASWRRGRDAHLPCLGGSDGRGDTAARSPRARVTHET